MSLLRFHPLKYFIPGTFFLVLGIGNILVGTYKGQQYQAIFNSLSNLEVKSQSTPDISPILRIQLAKDPGERLFQRQQKALARLELYALVTFGGKIFLLFSAIFLSISACANLLRS